MNMTKELKQAMKRVSAPPGFTERAVARATLSGRSWVSFRVLSRVAAVVALISLAAATGYWYVEEQQVRKGEAARQQLLLAMQITAEKAELTRRAIHEEERP